jgi:hypothetical protein
MGGLSKGWGKVITCAWPLQTQTQTQIFVTYCISSSPLESQSERFQTKSACFYRYLDGGIASLGGRAKREAYLEVLIS